MSIKNLPTFRRPREKLWAEGAAALSDIELIALILRCGTSKKNILQLSTGLLRKKRIQELLDMPYEKLLEQPGIGKAGAASLKAVYELARRIHIPKSDRELTQISQIVQHFEMIRCKKKEYFVGLYLNARKHLVDTKIISVGILDASIVHPREVFAPAIQLHAAEIIVGHNHPSGDPTPSHADILLTSRLVKAGDLLGIPITDHIIVSDSGYYSFSAIS